MNVRKIPMGVSGIPEQKCRCCGAWYEAVVGFTKAPKRCPTCNIACRSKGCTKDRFKRGAKR